MSNPGLPRSGERLRSAIKRKGVVQAMAAHSPLSALIAEEAGFDAIWASGFELSALFGLADSSLISMREHLDMTRAMAARVSIPVVADIDTGFGNAVNAAHAARLYEAAGAAAVVIEDKQFPKTSSLAPGGRHPLLRVEEFQGKIEAVRDAREHDDFVLVARTEALIAGHDMDEAVTRANAYADAGADMVLVHSKQSTANEIEAFASAWTRAIPIVVVPTTFPGFSVERARSFGSIGMIIWGNHAIRSCVAAMQETFAAIVRDGSAANAGGKIATVDEVFRLQDMQGIAETEKKFLR